MGTFGVKRASDDYFCPSTVYRGNPGRDLISEEKENVAEGGEYWCESR